MRDCPDPVGRVLIQEHKVMYRMGKSGPILPNRVGKAIQGQEAAYAKVLRSGVTGEQEKERRR